jgi:hypothetical protein
MNHDNDWGFLFDRNTPYETVEQIIRAMTADGIAEWRQQIEGDQDFSEAERERLIAFGVRFITHNTAKVLRDGWLMLQRPH